MKYLALALAALAALAFAPLAFAQNQPQPAAAHTDKSLVVSEAQKWHLEALELRIALIQTQAQQQATPHIQERQGLIGEMVKANPGYVWHEAQGPNDSSGLVPVAEPVSSPAIRSPTSPAGK